MEKVQPSLSQILNRATVSRELLERRLPEWIQLEQLLPELEKFGVIHDLGLSQKTSQSPSESPTEALPLIGISLGSQDPLAPVLGLFGGVHGLERIGAQVCLSLLKSLSEMMLWDSMIHQALKKIRIVAIPMINPLGMLHLQRSNPNGVDLMRNSPSEAKTNPSWLLGGHRLTDKLPWYRGPATQLKMETENEAVLSFCQAQFFNSKAVLTVDFHSGFGLQDQIWFPYAKSTQPFPQLSEMHALTQIFERTHPHHFYRIEPQAKNYTTHGDLWDYIYDQYRAQSSGTYLPLALEMGSWMWVRKNPLQIFSTLGPFNPMKPHRHKRILRRHMTLFDFLIRSVASHELWSSLNFEQKNKHWSQALELWYKQNQHRHPLSTKEA